MSRRPPTPLPERWLLSNGLTVLYRSSPEVPLAAATLIFAAGSAREPLAKSGLASFTMSLLLEGTRHHSARQFAEALETMGASMGADASEDYADAGFITPAQHLPKVLSLLGEVLKTPAFPPAEIKKEKAHTLAALRSRHDTLFNLAYDTLNRELFGAHHPYGRLVEGTPETVARFTREDCLTWHARHLRPERTILSLVAPPIPQLRALLERHLGSWKPHKKAVEAALIPIREVRSLPTHRLSSRFEQAYLMVGCHAPSSRESNFLATKLFNIAMGGGMSSRLFLELRENLGLAYEVSAFFPTRHQTSQWVCYLGLPPAKLPLARRHLKRLLDVAAERGISADELDQVKRMLKGAYWTEHQTRRRQAWYAAWWEFQGRDRDYDRRYLERIDAVTLEDVNAAGRSLLAQPRVVIEVVPKK